jgi:hypothetical protein
MNTCPNCGKMAGLHGSILQGCMCQYSMQALPQQEPVVGITAIRTWFKDGRVVTQTLCNSWVDTTPPQRKPLTDVIITQVIDSMPKKMKGFMVDWDLYEFAQAIEAKLKEKNT